MKTSFVIFATLGVFLLQVESLPLIGVPKTCLDILRHNAAAKSGVYKIDPDGKGPFQVYCDMNTDGGGWTLFQSRKDSKVAFFRKWRDYKEGFGDLNGEFWHGNDKLHRMTTATPHRLRVDMEDNSFNCRYAEYDTFIVNNETAKYALNVSGYKGDAGDSLSSHNGQKFTTKDQDNDLSSGNCAYTFGGAWWYGNCHVSNLNGKYHLGHHLSYADGVHWYHFRGHYYSLKVTQMKIRPKDFSLQLHFKYAQKKDL